MMKSATKINLLDMTRSDMEGFFAQLGEKPFRSSQVIQWLHQYGVQDFNEMTNLSKSLRSQLEDVSEIGLPEIVHEHRSEDGTYKWVLKLKCGNNIETVFIPESGRGTLCISSQVGCALNCSFCSTAQQGFNRNLSVAEIIGQIAIANKALGYDRKQPRIISNIVLMGMGEPLLNYDNVVKAVNLMLDDFAYGLSKRRVTLSTSGVVPALDRLKDVCDVSLAVSLHAPNDALRDQLVPLNKKYPIKELLAACKRYIAGEARRKITIEYVLLDGINDQPEHARQLIKLLRDVPSKVNLIPFNPFPNTIYKCSSPNVANKFRDILVDGGLNTITRKTRGDDINAACGQLVGKVNDRTKRQMNTVALVHGAV